MLVPIKSKQDLIKAIGQSQITLVDNYEVVNEADLRMVTEKSKTLLRQQSKLHVVLLKRA
jgi:hypothetical protein